MDQWRTAELFVQSPVAVETTELASLEIHFHQNCVLSCCHFVDQCFYIREPGERCI